MLPGAESQGVVIAGGARAGTSGRCNLHPMNGPASTELQQRLVRRILRVNHAGEHGAVAIYSRQLQNARRYPEFVPWIKEALAHEIGHRARFHAAMPSRSAKPCRLLSVWSIGGTALGWITSALGRNGLMVCTAAVERTVHQHLVEQIAYLDQRDPELARIIREIQVDEDAHLAFADAHHRGETVFARLLSGVVGSMTELLIFLSTRGDSLRLRHALRAAQDA